MDTSPDNADLKENDPQQPEIVAAIDLGSNSFHMIVARLDESGTLSIIDRIRESVRLGGGLTPQGTLDDEVQHRALECLERFAQRVHHLPHSAVSVAGTNTLRVAKNARQFVARAEYTLGHPIDIIAGREEARLIYLGVAHGLAAKEGKRLVVDIGGGSTEMIIGSGMESTRRESLYTGCVSATRRYFYDGVITKQRMDAAITNVELLVYSHVSMFHSREWDEAIGCSGTIKAIRNIVHAAGWCEVGICRESLYKLRDAYIDAGHVNEIRLDGISESRRPVLVGGVAVLLAVFEVLGIEQMDVSSQSLREGLLYELVGRIQHDDVRDAAVATAIQSWAIDRDQSQRVADTARLLCDVVEKKWKLNKDDFSALLKWAASLHEIGLQVSHSQYHRHGAYILKNADLAGFSRQEQALLAALVLCHRSKFRIDAFNELQKPYRKLGKRMCVLLRLAVLLHRGRSKLPIPDVRIKVSGKKVRLRFPENWLDDHGLTLADLHKERAHLETAGYKLKFE